MHIKHGELLPRENLEKSNRNIGYYIAENATLTIYQPTFASLSHLTLICFLIGCILGCLLFIWSDNARSTDMELALLRRASVPASEQNHFIVMPAINSLAAKKPKTQKTRKKQQVVVSAESRNKRLASSDNYSIEISKNDTSAVVDIIRHAVALAAVQDFKSAESTLLNQYRRGLSSPELLNALGVLYSNQAVWKKAALSFERACKNINDDGLCYYNLAVCYDHLKKPHKALDAYQQALKNRSPSKQVFDVVTVENRMQELQEW